MHWELKHKESIWWCQCERSLAIFLTSCCGKATDVWRRLRGHKFIWGGEKEKRVERKFSLHACISPRPIFDVGLQEKKVACEFFPPSHEP